MRRSQFDLSHHHLMTGNMGMLLPVMCEEVLPGDTFQAQHSMLLRVSPLVTPVMHPVEIRLHSWYVPNRLLYPEWEKFITQKDPDAVPPEITLTTEGAALADHFGIPPDVGLDVDALPFAAYNLVWSEYYRDQDLDTDISEIVTNPDDASYSDELQVLRRISWEKDYFTTARPYPQQGDAISIGFSSGLAPITGIGMSATANFAADGNSYLESSGESVVYPASRAINAASLGAIRGELGTDQPEIFADLSNMTGGIDINDLRRSIALQRIAEARSRYGSRYVDMLRFYGVNPSDGRLDRPEYLGGGKQYISFSEVLATAEGTNTNVGDMAGHGIGAVRSRRWRKMFEEHGWCLTMLSVRPQTMYTDAFPRKFRRRVATDYWHRELEVLPWQSISEQEVYAQGDPATVFGWSPRYNEYRHNFSYVSGEFRNSTMDSWHMARQFDSAPALNSTFVSCLPTDRIYADTNIDQLIISCRNVLRARRLVAREARIDHAL